MAQMKPIDKVVGVDVGTSAMLVSVSVSVSGRRCCDKTLAVAASNESMALDFMRIVFDPMEEGDLCHLLFLY